MADQHERVFRYLLVELREYAALLRGLIADAEGADATDAAIDRARSVLGEATPIVEMPIPQQAELAALTKALKQAADDLFAAARRDGTADFQRAASERVMSQSESQVIRERVWLRGAGFELEPDKLPSLDEVLG